MTVPAAPWSVADTGWATLICDRLGPRRSRLFLSACCRGYCPNPLPPEAADAFEVFDRFADTGKSKVAVREARERVGRIPRTYQYGGPVKFARKISNMQFTDTAIPKRMLEEFGEAYMVLEDILSGDLDVRVFPKLGVGAEWNLKLSHADARAYLERALGELGYPEPPVARLDPGWRTADVVDLARGIYRERAFDRMPVLADALMDAGCEDKDVLGHCRARADHVRGCWVLDLILDGQWEAVWSDATPVARAKKPKPPAAPAGSPYRLTPAVAREVDELVKGEAKRPAAEVIARAYAGGKRDRKQAAQTMMQYFGWSAGRAEAYATFKCLEVVRDGLQWGIARRVRRDDPRELVQYVSLAARAELFSLWLDPARETLDWIRPVVLAAAGGDGRVLRRFAETGPFPLKAGKADDVCWANAVYALAADDLAAFRGLFPYKPKRKANGSLVPYLACLEAVALGDPGRFAAGLGAIVEETGRSGKGVIYGLIDVDAHGVYELCRRAHPEGVAGFDVNHPPPWDAALARWVRGRADALADFDWETIPEEIRPGLRDLSRPTWADAPTA